MLSKSNSLIFTQTNVKLAIHGFCVENEQLKEEGKSKVASLGPSGGTYLLSNNFDINYY